MIRKSFLLTPMLLASAFAQGGGVSASINRNLTFPPVGLGSTESLQVNLLNTAKAPATGTAPSCKGNVNFTNAAGTAIGTATSFTVASGQIVSVDLPFTKAGITGIRGEILVSVQQTVAVPSLAPCALVLSLEIFDSTTGATHAVLTSAAEGLATLVPGR